MKRILVLGHEGYIGYSIYSLLIDSCTEQYNTIGTDLVSRGHLHVDVTNKKSLEDAVKRHHPDIIIYCVATRIFESQSNPEKAQQINVQPIYELSKYFKGKLVYFSSCMVFDGENAPYGVTAETNPKSIYGQTKVAAEKIIQEEYLEYLIIRPGYVYGYNGRQYDHFTSTVLADIRKGSFPIEHDGTILRRPVSVGEVCTRTISLLGQKKTKFMQLNGNTSLTKFIWSQAILRSVGYSNEDISRLVKELAVDKEAFIARDTRMINTVAVCDSFYKTIDIMPNFTKFNTAKGMFMGEQFLQYTNELAVIEGQQRYSYGELDKMSTKMAHGLLAQGAHVNDRVALLLPNSVELVIAYLACFKIGAICVPIMTRVSTENMEHILKNTKPIILIVKSNMWRKYSSVTVDTMLKIYYQDAERYNSQSLESLYSEVSIPLPTVSPEVAATIFFTSGSTGKPKGAVHTQKQLMAVAKVQSGLLKLSNNSQSLAGTSLCHGFSVGTMLFSTLYAGGTVILLDNPDQRTLFSVFKEYQVTCYSGTPIHYNSIKRHLENHPHALKGTCLSFCNCSGDILPYETLKYFRSIGFPVYTSIGMTETHTIAKNTPVRNNDDSLGQILPGVQLKLDANGQLLVKSPTVTVGYWRNETENNIAFDDDGWFRTGDIAEIHNNNYHFKGRVKQIIRHCAINYAPQEIEGWIYPEPEIKQSGCIGIRHELYGQQLYIYVTLQDGIDVDHLELLNRLTRKVKDGLGSLAMTALRGIEIIDLMPITSLGKIDRAALEDIFTGSISIEHFAHVSPGLRHCKGC